MPDNNAVLAGLLADIPGGSVLECVRTLIAQRDEALQAARLAPIAPDARSVDGLSGEALSQALTDPENQPSQWGTIPLTMLPAARPMRYGAGPMDNPEGCEEGIEHGYDQGWNACLAAIDRRLAGAKVQDGGE